MGQTKITKKPITRKKTVEKEVPFVSVSNSSTVPQNPSNPMNNGDSMVPATSMNNQSMSWPAPDNWHIQGADAAKRVALEYIVTASQYLQEQDTARKIELATKMTSVCESMIHGLQIGTEAAENIQAKIRSGDEAAKINLANLKATLKSLATTVWIHNYVALRGAPGIQIRLIDGQLVGRCVRATGLPLSDNGIQLEPGVDPNSLWLDAQPSQVQQALPIQAPPEEEPVAPEGEIPAETMDEEPPAEEAGEEEDFIEGEAPISDEEGIEEEPGEEIPGEEEMPEEEADDGEEMLGELTGQEEEELPEEYQVGSEEEMPDEEVGSDEELPEEYQIEDDNEPTGDEEIVEEEATEDIPDEEIPDGEEMEEIPEDESMEDDTGMEERDEPEDLDEDMEEGSVVEQDGEDLQEEPVEEEGTIYCINCDRDVTEEDIANCNEPGCPFAQVEDTEEVVEDTSDAEEEPSDEESDGESEDQVAEEPEEEETSDEEEPEDKKENKHYVLIDQDDHSDCEKYIFQSNEFTGLSIAYCKSCDKALHYEFDQDTWSSDDAMKWVHKKAKEDRIKKKSPEESVIEQLMNKWDADDTEIKSIDNQDEEDVVDLDFDVLESVISKSIEESGLQDDMKNLRHNLKNITG